jgi:hypothetical protein
MRQQKAMHLCVASAIAALLVHPVRATEDEIGPFCRSNGEYRPCPLPKQFFQVREPQKIEIGDNPDLSFLVDGKMFQLKKSELVEVLTGDDSIFCDPDRLKQ